MFFMKCQVVAVTVATTFFTASLAASPFAYITNQLDDSISIIDTEQGKVVDTISVPGKPAGVAVAARPVLTDRSRVGPRTERRE